MLPSGSASNEALRSEINNLFPQTQHIHQATLALKLDMMALGKLLTHNLAMYHPTAWRSVGTCTVAEGVDCCGMARVVQEIAHRQLCAESYAVPACQGDRRDPSGT